MPCRLLRTTGRQAVKPFILPDGFAGLSKLRKIAISLALPAKTGGTTPYLKANANGGRPVAGRAWLAKDRSSSTASCMDAKSAMRTASIVRDKLLMTVIMR